MMNKPLFSRLYNWQVMSTSKDQDGKNFGCEYIRTAVRQDK